MVSIESLLNIIPAVGVIIALVYYSMTLRYTTKARQRELIFLRSQGYSIEYSKAYADVYNMVDWVDAEDWQRKYGIKTNPEAFAKQLYIRQVFNMAGLLLQEKEADPDLIFKLYTPNSIIPTWEQFEPLVQNTRESHGFPDHWEPFEFLYNEAKKRYPEISRKRIEERRLI
jgi:hypothetical protein